MPASEIMEDDSPGDRAKVAGEEVARLEAQLAALKEAERIKQDKKRAEIKAKAQPFLSERAELRERIEKDSDRVRVLTEELVNMGWEEPRGSSPRVGWSHAKGVITAIAKKTGRALPEWANDPEEWKTAGGSEELSLPPDWLNRVLLALASKRTTEPVVSEEEAL